MVQRKIFKLEKLKTEYVMKLNGQRRINHIKKELQCAYLASIVQAFCRDWRKNNFLTADTHEAIFD